MAQLRRNGVLGAATGGRPANVFTTLGRHQRLFRRWLRFTGALMPGGRLPRVDTELLILRVAHNCHCDYEWRHTSASGSSPACRRTTCDASARARMPALHADRDIPDELWGSLGAELADADLIELCLLVGHY